MMLQMMLLSLLSLITMIMTMMLLMPMFISLMLKNDLRGGVVEHYSAFKCYIFFSSFSIRFFINSTIHHLRCKNYPITSNTYTNPMKSKMSMFIILFIMILSTGLMYEWMEGSLNWKYNYILNMMTMLLMMNIVMILIWIILSMNNPMNMKLMITMMAMVMSLLMSLTMSSWYVMTLFLIYVGGMMMMFSYFVSLSSNDSMMMKSKFHFIILPFVPIKSFKLRPMLPMYNNMKMNKLYPNNNMTIMLLMTMILFMMMLIIVKMVKINNDPLQSFNKL